ncbi:hypothetical protein jhhlp_006822 [Lomentospora prolificans]|uniref:CFEM domain-containing protein n=1 Tax=Lomentospora prolificans TaxID=41688 RepID=A0A2N3N2U8_9PEZI|nr:hypothetical protein jhhlp_006822 [Lomentospora prolificans]
MHRLSAILVLAGLAAERVSAAVPNLPSCQSRCYDLTAEMIGCGKDDYRCHCDVFQSQFVPQIQSCMIEGSFAYLLDVTELQGTVCALAGQSLEPTSTSGSPSGSDPQPSQTSSAAPTDPSDSSGTDTLPSTESPSTSSPSTPSTTPSRTSNSQDDPEQTNSTGPGDGSEEGAASALPGMSAGVAAGILAAAMAAAYLF